MATMNIVLLTFGSRLENHYQASFAILSFLKDPAVKRVIMVTDRPEFYAFFGNKIEFIQINEDTLTQWQGEYQFFWRVKIKALEKVQKRYPAEHLLYIDSDTFLATDLAGIQDKLSQNQLFMHKLECALGDEIDNTTKKMHNSLKDKTFAGIRLDSQSTMWNAGVIALPANKAKEIITLSLQLCDEICATDCTRRLVEQFSFSIALNHYGELNACDHIIGHYWGNKNEWNKLISAFFVNALLKNLSLQDCINEVAEFDWNRLPIHKKQRSTNSKLKALTDKYFPDKNISYFSK
ncbi:hypothetical protein [Basfia succiniciproducens]|nr:hypothetical protein [Basfia succiniciproducens]